MHKIPTAIVVDDEIELMGVFCEYLQMLDIEVVGRGYDGKDAIELYIQKNPDIVFLDVMMPQYDGFFALQGIKAIDPAARVIILTADTSSETAKRLEGLGPHKVIFKPFRVDQIIDAVEGIRGTQLGGLVVHTKGTLAQESSRA